MEAAGPTDEEIEDEQSEEMEVKNQNEAKDEEHDDYGEPHDHPALDLEPKRPISRRRSGSLEDTAEVAFNIAWPKLKELGWDMPKEVALSIGTISCQESKKKDGKMGETVFSSQEAVVEYVRSHHSDLLVVETTSDESKAAQALGNLGGDSGKVEKMIKQKNKKEAASAKKTKKSRSTSSQPPSRRTFRRSLEPENFDEIFNSIWPLLKEEGWTHTSGSGLIDWYYLIPGTSRKTATLHVNMFDSARAVVEYAREHFADVFEKAAKAEAEAREKAEEEAKERRRAEAEAARRAKARAEAKAKAKELEELARRKAERRKQRNWNGSHERIKKKKI